MTTHAYSYQANFMINIYSKFQHLLWNRINANTIPLYTKKLQLQLVIP